MPTYDLKNTETGEVKEFLVSISKKEEMVASGEWEQVHLGVPDLVSHTGSITSAKHRVTGRTNSIKLRNNPAQLWSICGKEKKMGFRR